MRIVDLFSAWQKTRHPRRWLGKFCKSAFSSLILNRESCDPSVPTHAQAIGLTPNRFKLKILVSKGGWWTFADQKHPV